MTAASLSGLDACDLDDVLAHRARFADDLRGGRVVVTGATGWFGTWLLDALVALNRSCALDLTVVAVSRDPAAFARRHPALARAPELTWSTADVREADIDFGPRCTHVIHAATDTSATSNATRPDVMFETIVAGTSNVLRAASRTPGVKCLLVSSGAVYGRQPVGIKRLAEDHAGAPDPLDAANAYAEGKRAAEHRAAIEHALRGLHVTIARCFAFVGPHMPLDAHFAVGNLIRDTMAGVPLHIRGNGAPLRSYLYMSDLVVWLLAILVDGRPMRPYNVGGDEAVSILDLARRCMAVAGADGVIDVAGEPQDARDYVPDIGRARDELGLRIGVPLDRALRRTMDWATTRPQVVAATSEAAA